MSIVALILSVAAVCIAAALWFREPKASVDTLARIFKDHHLAYLKVGTIEIRAEAEIPQPLPEPPLSLAERHRKLADVKRREAAELLNLPPEMIADDAFGSPE